MITVKFNSVGEFCEEMAKDAPGIERQIVRLTNMFKPSGISPNIENLFVVATYSVPEQVIRLERFCGQIWGIYTSENEKANEAAKKALEAVEEACGKLGLQVRPGVLEP